MSGTTLGQNWLEPDRLRKSKASNQGQVWTPVEKKQMWHNVTEAFSTFGAAERAAKSILKDTSYRIVSISGGWVIQFKWDK